MLRKLAGLFAVVLAASCVDVGWSAPSYGVDATEHSVGGKTVDEVFSDAGVRALAVAACEGRVETVAQLIEGGIEPDSQGLDGVTPLIWAQSCDSLPGMGALLERGADPNKRFYQYNAVWLAAESYRVEQLQLLFQHGADLSFVSADGKTVLIAAIRRGDRDQGWENFEFLLQSGAPINQITRAAWLADRETTAAEDAAGLNQYRRVVQLLELGYNVRLRQLGRIIEVQIRDHAPIPAQEAQWRERAQEILVRRGVQFPIGLIE